MPAGKCIVESAADPLSQCDEQRPRCYNCEKHGVVCDFEFPEAASEYIAQTPRSAYAATPAATPAPTHDGAGAAAAASPTSTVGASRAVSLPRAPSFPAASPTSVTIVGPAASSSSARLLELRLLHHYLTVTCKTMSHRASEPDHEHIWRDNVPRVAFAASSGSATTASNHLTDSVLAVAALHLRSEFPNDRELVRASHAYMASSISEYNRLLRKGITASNAEALFLNSTFITFQSTATRIFNKDEPVLAAATQDAGLDLSNSSSDIIANASFSASSGGYGLPMSWFHAFQGVKAVTAASWPWLRQSDVVIPIINAQPALHLDIASAQEGFFGHLLNGLDEELGVLASETAQPADGQADATPGSSFLADDVCSSHPTADEAASFRQQDAASEYTTIYSVDELMRGGLRAGSELNSQASSSRHAYMHAVAVLNWAHNSGHSAACLAFPATVSRAFVELLTSRTPRALAILACFFGMLKKLDSAWWLRGMARREVLGVVSLFNSDAFSVDVERRWWPHLQWAVRVALYHDEGHAFDYVPPEIWNASFHDTTSTANAQSHQRPPPPPPPPPTIDPNSYASHIDLIAESVTNGGATGGGTMVCELDGFDFSDPVI